MRLHIIGTGCPTPRATAFGSAFVLEVSEDLLLIDCGPATTYKMARADIRVETVHHLFLTHHHYDHNADLPCFALSRWDHLPGEPPLSIYGPPPTASIVERLFAPERGAFYEDWKARVEYPVSQQLHKDRGGKLPRPAPAFDVQEVTSGPVAEGKGWRATCERVQHVEPWLESIAFRFETEEGSVAFAGDCADCPALRNFASQADTLVIASAYYGRDLFSEVITSHVEAAEVAGAADAKRVVLTHMNPGFFKPGIKEKAVVEVSQVYGGEILFPEEGAVIDL